MQEKAICYDSFGPKKIDAGEAEITSTRISDHEGHRYTTVAKIKKIYIIPYCFGSGNLVRMGRSEVSREVLDGVVHYSRYGPERYDCVSAILAIFGG